ncbi:MAG: ribosome biogenesis GTPase Der [bacterium]|nr:ribosome biogenesis GTPase Der [bacterium]
MKNKLPIVTIVGRRNVGKSTLFNALTREKKAIVDSVPGLTRDILSFTVNYKSIHFTLSDTPGLDLPDSSDLSAPILENARAHLERSSIIILLMENPGAESFDIDLADFVRKLSIPTIIAVNKMDHSDTLENMTNFYELGFNEIIPISALRKFNLNLLLDKIAEHLPVKKTSVQEPDIKISIAGRPNSGKSTLLNSFIGYNRAVVSEIPGTTRDSVNDHFNFREKHIEIIDTAGIRKKSKITENVEYYSFTRTIDSINRSDVVIHLIDAQVGLTETDKKISDEIMKAKKPMIIAINKWDAVDKNDKTFEEFRDKLAFKFYKADDFPIVSISAKDKTRIHKILITALELKQKAEQKINTPALNKLIASLQSSGRIPQLGHKLKIYYATQIESVPPQFKFFVNNPEFFKKDVIRYFEKALQKELNLFGIPIIIHIEGKKEREKQSRGKKGRKKQGRSFQG